MYIQIDAQGNPKSFPMVPENIESIMGKKLQEISDEELRAAGYAEIKHYIEPPKEVWYDISRGQIVRNDQGEVEQLWNRIELSPQEKVRSWLLGPRDFKMMTSDWTQLADAPLDAPMKAAWAVYRQALRDMTDVHDWATMKSPEEIVWPEEPHRMSKDDPNKWLKTS